MILHTYVRGKNLTYNICIGVVSDNKKNHKTGLRRLNNNNEKESIRTRKHS
jgi:hypothetical protein